jgi:hypothetical protein
MGFIDRAEIGHMAITPQFPTPPRPTPQRPSPQPQTAASAPAQPGFAQWAQSKSKWFWLAVFAGVFIVGTIVQWILAPAPKPQAAQEQQNPRAITGIPTEAPKAAEKTSK